jgi:hypothetical protein
MNYLLRGFVVAVGFLVGASSLASAQWGVAVTLQRTGFGGTSYDTSSGGTQASFRPGNTPAVTLRADRRIGRVALGFGIRYSRSAILLDGPDLFVGLPDEIATVEAVPEVRFRLLRSLAGASVSGYAGPVIGVWMIRDQGSRAVLGGIAGACGEFPVLDRLSLEVRAGAGVTGSLFRPGELPPEFERRLTWRTEIGLGLRYGR